MPAADAAIRTSTGPRDHRLDPIVEKVEAGRRLSAEDGLLLYETPDVWTLGTLADLVRRRLHGDVTYYNVNRHVNYSNLCALSCTFCSFYRKKGQAGAYEMSVDDIRAEARAAAGDGATEIHIVGGLHPWLPFDYYLDMLRAIRDEAPALHVKAFTAVEIVHFARITKRWKQRDEGIRAVLGELRDAGLGSLPGGGAEVFDDRVHDEAYKHKISAGEWLDVHRVAHEIGINSNATMLYGHIEDRADRIGHLLRLREEQDRTLRDWAGQGDAVVLTGPDTPPLPDPDACSTGWFQTIIPLPFIPDDSALGHLPGPTGMENLRTVAIARLMLDNFPHVKAFWIMQTLEMAQFMLQNGADDLDGTVVWYDITKVAGSGTHQETTVADLRRVIREAGLRPVERDTLYREVTRPATP